jgi:hypothetical protein
MASNQIVSSVEMSTVPEYASFPNFGLLPKEIRFMIWEASLEPRLIHLEYGIGVFDARNPPDFLYLLGGDFPYEHFTMESIERPAEPYYTGYISPSTATSPAALAVHRESRELLISIGYIPWTIVSYWGVVKRIMWCPSIDILFFPPKQGGNPVLGLTKGRYFDVFLKQFPHEARQVKNLALPGRYWPSIGRQFPMDPKNDLAKLEALSKLIVVLDKAHERQYVITGRSQATFGMVQDDPWVIPTSIEECLQEALSGMQNIPHAPVNRTIPSVKLAWSENDVIKGLYVQQELTLRCYPCEHIAS